MKKIIGVTVGTPISPSFIKDKLGNAGFATEKYVQENYQSKGDYLARTELTNAVNTALAQAKASGEFDGETGKKPEKGVDYYTETDKNEMVNAVLSALPTWTGGAF